MANSALKKILITGAGTGFGYEAPLRLALRLPSQADRVPADPRAVARESMGEHAKP
jgi:NAD(P)-dependent dehydrogenase (short-subunit alcohol dehydrogenase family)